MARFTQVFLRHGLMLVPLWIIAFAAIAGWLGGTFGLQNLFRDHPFEFADRLPNVLTAESIRYALTTSGFQIAVYAMAFLGLSWSIAVLAYIYETDPETTHPVTKTRPLILPVVLLGLIPIVAGQLAIADELLDPHFTAEVKRQYRLVGAALSVAGVFAGFLIIWAATAGAIYLSYKSHLPQLFTAIAISFILILIFAWPAWLMPGFAFFLLLSVFVLIYGLGVALPAKRRFVVVLGLLTWGLICGGISFKHRFAEFAPYYAGTRPRPKLETVSYCKKGAVRQAAAPYLTPPLEYLDAWRANALEVNPNQRPVFVVVAASGGGYRASYWSALVLDRLTAGFPQARKFKPAAGLVTGASGGMVTGAYFAAMSAAGLLDGTSPKSLVSALDGDIIEGTKSKSGMLQRMFRNAKRDSLTPVVQQLLQYDLPRSFWPMPLEHDRGSVLQEQWRLIGKTKFNELFFGEAFSPAIVFSPMLVNSGRPLLVSNLDLSCLATKDTQAVELFRLFPGTEGEVSLATAARMSASFPYVTPATELPVEPEQRVVDAGYYDNDGIGTAAAFLLTPDVKIWLEKHVSRVIVLRLNAFQRASPHPCSVKPDSPEALSFFDRILASLNQRYTRSTHWFSSPIEGAWVARDTKARFSNRQTIDALALAYPPGFLNEVEFAFDGFAAESWHLPENELRAMRLALGEKNWDGKIDTPSSCANLDALNVLETLLSQP
jgi:hypothetical protein